MQTALDLDGPSLAQRSLDHCDGYLVEAARGRLGFVDGVDQSLGTFTVRRDGTRVLVELADVALIDSHDHRLVLRGSPRLRGTVRERA